MKNSPKCDCSFQDSFPCCSFPECALEHVVKYGETYTIPLNHIEGPITLMFRCSQVYVWPTKTEKHSIFFLYTEHENIVENTGFFYDFSHSLVILLVSRPGLDQGNHTLTKTPPLVMYNRTTVLAAEYAGRLIVSEKRVMLHSVRMTDEGSYMVLDRDNKVQKRNCLNVRGEERSLV